MQPKRLLKSPLKSKFDSYDPKFSIESIFRLFFLLILAVGNVGSMIWKKTLRTTSSPKTNVKSIVFTS